MENNSIFSWIEQTLGALLILLVILDVFLTVLYARANIGLISNIIEIGTWRFFLALSKFFERYRGIVLSLCGPISLTLLVATWILMLALGAALIIHPNLGTSVQSSGGETPTDFVTAMYAGGSSMSLVGASDFMPKTDGFRLFYLLISLVGTSLTTLTLTYLFQVYTALQRKNALGLTTHLATGETGDAAELLAGLGPEGKFDNGYSNLAEMAVEMTGVKESHHFYNVLFYFRFQETYYSISQSTLVALDTVSLIKSALSDEKYAWLKQSMSAAQLWRASMMLLKTSADTFLSGKTFGKASPDTQTRSRWQNRYNAALKRLRQANIETIADEQAGFETYVSLRSEWDGYITSLAPLMAYEMEDIDTAGTRPKSADERQNFRARSHSAG